MPLRRLDLRRSRAPARHRRRPLSGQSAGNPAARVPRRALSVLRGGGGSRRRFAREPRLGDRPPPARMPGLRPPLHHLREGRGDRFQGGQERRYAPGRSTGRSCCSGLEKACEKRPVSPRQLEEIADAAENLLAEREDREISTRELGDFLMDRLRDLDQVAYVRFASVYRRFEDVERVHGRAQEAAREGPRESREGGEEEEEEAMNDDNSRLPDLLPVLPLKDAVLYPYIIVPLSIGRESSIQAVDAALSEHRLLALVAQRDPAVEEPGADDLYDGRHRGGDHADAEAPGRADPDPGAGDRAHPGRAPVRGRVVPAGAGRGDPRAPSRPSRRSRSRR